MPLYRGFRRGGSPPSEEGPTRRIARPGSALSPDDDPSTVDESMPAVESGRASAKPSSATIETTRRVARPDPTPRSRSESVSKPLLESPPAANPANPATTPETPVAVRDPLSNPIVGWLAITAGPGRGTVLPLSYGVNDIGRGSGVRIRLDFGDAQITLGNQAIVIYAAIIYTARSRRFYVQSVAAETLLNGRPLRESTELNGGETLQLGQTRLRFVPLCGADFDWRDGG